MLRLTAKAEDLHSSSVKSLINRGLARKVGAYVMLTPLGREYINAGSKPLRKG